MSAGFAIYGGEESARFREAQARGEATEGALAKARERLRRIQAEEAEDPDVAARRARFEAFKRARAAQSVSADHRLLRVVPKPVRERRVSREEISIFLTESGFEGELAFKFKSGCIAKVWPRAKPDKAVTLTAGTVPDLFDAIKEHLEQEAAPEPRQRNQGKRSKRRRHDGKRV